MRTTLIGWVKTVWEIDNFFRVKFLFIFWDHNSITNDVVNIFCAHRSLDSRDSLPEWVRDDEQKCPFEHLP